MYDRWEPSLLYFEKKKKKKKEQLQNGIPLVHYLLLGLVFKFVDCKFLLFLTWPIVS